MYIYYYNTFTKIYDKKQKNKKIKQLIANKSNHKILKKNIKFLIKIPNKLNNI